MPKAIRSLKSNGCLSMSTTPILCRNRGLPPCNTIALILLYHVFIKIVSLLNRQSFDKFRHLTFSTNLSYIHLSIPNSLNLLKIIWDIEIAVLFSLELRNPLKDSSDLEGIQLLQIKIYKFYNIIHLPRELGRYAVIRSQPVRKGDAYEHI